MFTELEKHTIKTNMTAELQEVQHKIKTGESDIQLCITNAVEYFDLYDFVQALKNYEMILKSIIKKVSK